MGARRRRSQPPRTVSLVIPVFNEGENVDALFVRLRPVMDEIERTRPVECVLVDDGSRDDSLSRLLDQQGRDARVRVVEFNRNYGQHAAVFAGFDHSTGEVIITLDADLQNPPEEIPKLLEKIDEGYDVVATRRMDRQDSGFRKFASSIVNKTTKKMIGVDSGDFGCMLRAYRREIVEAMSSSKELSTFIPALAEIYSGSTAVLDVRHEERTRGESKYSIFKLMRLHMDLVTSFSVAPLRAMLTVGLGIGILGFMLSLGILATRFVMSRDQWEAWGQGGVFTLFAVLYIFVGVQLIGMGLLGEYVGRIYSEVRRRPRFVVRRFHTDGATVGDGVVGDGAPQSAGATVYPARYPVRPSSAGADPAGGAARRGAQPGAAPQGHPPTPPPDPTAPA